MNKELLESYASLISGMELKQAMADMMRGTSEGDQLQGEANAFAVAARILADHASIHDKKLMAGMREQQKHGEQPTFELEPIEKRFSL